MNLGLQFFMFALVVSGSLLLPTLIQGETPVVVDQSIVQGAALASKTWLDVIDKGNYSQSWDDSSILMKRTVHKDEWLKILNAMRKPLGNLVSRQVLDERIAKNPHGLPPGDYMVMVYKTAFSQKANANELVTLSMENGNWRVMTYEVN